MSDVIVTTSEPVTTVTTIDNVVQIDVTQSPVEVSASTAGVQGASGIGYTGVTSTSTITIGTGLKTFTLVSGYAGAFITGMRIRAIHSDTPTYFVEGTANYVGAGTLIITVDKFNGSGSHNLWAFSVAGISGVVSADAPITYNSGTQTVGINQSAISIAQSQVTNLVSDLASKANLAGGNAFTGAQTATGTAIGDKVFVVKGASGQTANLFEVQDSTGAFRVRINQVGNSTFAGNITSQNNALFTPFSASTVPLTVQGAASQTAPLLEIRNSANTLLSYNLSNGDWVMPNLFNSYAGVGMGYADYQGTATSLYVRPTLTTRSGAVIKGLASQTANLLEIQNSAGSILASFDSSGRLNSATAGNFGGLTPGSAFLGVQTSANTLALLVKGGASQVADLARYVDSGNNGLGGVNGVGQIYTGSTTPILTATGGTIQSIATGANPLVTMATGHNLTTGDLVTLAGTTGGTYNGTFVVASTPSVGQFTITTALTTGQASAGGTVSDPAQASITARSSGTTGLIVKGASFQSANLLEFRDSSNNIHSGVLSTGFAWFGGSSSAGGQLGITTESATNRGLVIKGAVSQSANLQEWQNDAGTVRARIDSGGNFKAFNLASNNSALQIFESNSGGAVLFGKATAQASSPGAGFATMYFRDGTTAGTLKLVVRAGASGAETTILDNIPQ